VPVPISEQAVTGRKRELQKNVRRVELAVVKSTELDTLPLSESGS
jgi:hypothetical protein